jgi:enolase-phosphatase E1
VTDNAQKVKAIVTDIEGTTSSLSFVKDVLFPYAKDHLADYVRCHAEEDAIVPLLNEVRMMAGEELSLERVIAQLLQWIDEDRKATPLKALQGLIWEEGYHQGDFSGHIYADAKDKLERWRQQGIPIYVYSSGSVHAQKLLFGHTDYGDLTPLFHGYFDTRVGAKIEADAYRQIAQAIHYAPEEILFLSDIEAELDAARAAGMQTVWLLREGEMDANANHPQVRDFSKIEL